MIDEPMGRAQFIMYSAVRAILHPKILLEVNPFQVLQAEREFRKHEVSLADFVGTVTHTSSEEVEHAMLDYMLPKELQRYEARMCLYGIVKMLKPDNVVETGVGGGYGAAHMLHAMMQNNNGHLSSIDSHEHYNAKYFALPDGLPCGGMIPSSFVERWNLCMDGAEKGLPAVLDKLGTIDMFVHDSLHTYKNMMFEFGLAWDHLRPGGVLMSHDIWMPWVRFAKQVGRDYVVYQHYGALTK